MAPADKHAAIKASCTKTLECSDRNACDVELLTVGGFSPLTGFMNQADYDSVVADMRTKAGLLFGLPIVLDTDREDLNVGDKVCFGFVFCFCCCVVVVLLHTPRRHTHAHAKQNTQPIKTTNTKPNKTKQTTKKVLLQYQGQDLAAVTIESKWVPNKPLECLKCYGTSSLEHPAVQMVAMERGKYYMGALFVFSLVSLSR